MSRPSWPRIWLDLAVSLAERSTCERLKVGCVIARVDNSQVLAVGYNGNYKGGPNKCDSATPGACGCLHAEDNALLKYTRDWMGAVMYCTHLPCVQCAKRIVNAGIYRVIYLHEYRNTEAKRILPETQLIMYVDHRGHGRGSIDGPDDPDCPCRGDYRYQADCAAEGCGFCIAAEDRKVCVD